MIQATTILTFTGFFRSGSKAGIQAAHEARRRLILGVLDQATSEDDVKALNGLGAHRLSGKERGFISVWVNDN